MAPRRSTSALLWAVLAAFAPAAFATSIAFDKGPLVLGRIQTVMVTIKVDEPPGTEDRPLQLAVNVGSFGSVTRQGPGLYRAVYTLPPTRFPQVALVAAWRETGAEAPIDFLRVPLHGATRLPVHAKKGSQVTVEIGTEKFGPVTADKKGQAEVPVIIPPQVEEAVVVVTEPKGTPTRATVPVALAPYNRLTAALVPHALVADGEVNARIDVFYDLGGADVPPDKVRVKASLGDAVFEQADHGRYSFRFTPAAGVAGKKVKFEISVDGDPTAKANTEVFLGLSPPSRIVLRPPETQLVADGRSIGKAAVQVFDATGLGLSKMKVEITASGKPLQPVVDKGDGRYEVSYTVPLQYPTGGLVMFAAAVADPSGGPKLTSQQNYRLKAPNAPKSLLAQVEPDIVPMDGQTQAVVQLEVRDEQGAPIKGVRLTAEASEGTVGPITELGNGRYQSTYLAPVDGSHGEPTLKISDASGALQHSVPLRLRSDPRKVHVGMRAGYTKGLGDLSGPRAEFDAVFPFRIASNYLAISASMGVGQGAQLNLLNNAVPYPSSIIFVPAAIRLMYEAVISSSLSLYAGGGAIAGFGVNSTPGDQQMVVGLGVLGAVSAAYRIGPGHTFLELSVGVAPTQSEPVKGESDVTLDMSGISVEAGYRIALF